MKRTSKHVYREDFETGELRAWASYPPCQDTAYDPFIYPGKIRSGDDRTCLVAVKYPPWNETQLLGAVKLLDLVFDHDSRIGFSYYIKTVDRCSGLEVHIPLVTGERLIYTVDEPPVNRWSEVTIRWNDLQSQNNALATLKQVGMTALAIQIRVPKADSDMPIFFALDAIEICALRKPSFSFTVPRVDELSEWPERIALDHYRPGDELAVEGTIDCSPETVTMTITPFADRDRVLYHGEFSQSGDNTWKIEAFVLDEPRFSRGFYYGEITAASGGETGSVTPFIFAVVSGIADKHPRLMYDDATIATFKMRMQSDRYRSVRDNFIKNAASHREKLDPATLLYDFDQFPTKDWIETLWNWFIHRIMLARESLHLNSVVYSLLDDREAGLYCRDLMLVMAQWPRWNHPWMENRGYHTYFPVGEFSHAFAVAYDLVYDLMTDKERRIVREGLLKNFVIPAYRTYVEHNQITNNTSNWISHIAGGALVSLCALYGDDPGHGSLEPYLAGFLLKLHRYIMNVFGADGSYGEGYRYYSFAMQSFAKTLPVLERILGIDFSGPMHYSYRETLWAGIVRSNTAFTFGDSESYLKKEAQAYWIGSENGPMNSWAWLLERTRDPYLSWLYHSLKDFDTFQEVLYETDGLPSTEPDGLGDVSFFRDVGTAVFRSGWSADDFVFVFRSGPFYNHQHCDQGSFYFADHGRIFLEERYDGEHHYYDDPLYQSYAIQTISHNTILINRNPQSQKVGDPAGFAAGMKDQAVFARWLDAPDFAFVSGELERVYTESLKSLRRHVLFIKPRTILLVDEVVPEKPGVELDAIFHTKRQSDIAFHDGCTVFEKDGPALSMYHLAPSKIDHDSIAEPHFKCQFETRSLVKRGYLRVSAKCDGSRLIMAHLMTATRDGSRPAVTITPERDSVTGAVTVDGRTTAFAVNTSGKTITFHGYSSDALIIARSEDTADTIAAPGTTLVDRKRMLLQTDKPVVVHHSSTGARDTFNLHVEEPGTVRFGVCGKPHAVTVNGAVIETASRSSGDSWVDISLPGGVSVVEFSSIFV